MALFIGFLVAVPVWLSAGEELTDRFFGDVLIPEMATLAMVAAAVAALASWGEIDLSFFGTIAVGTFIYGEAGEESAVLALVIAAAVGVIGGALVGLLRWGTQAPLPYLTLGVGLVGLFGAESAMFNQGVPQFGDTELIEGSGIPVVLALVVVAASVGVSLLGKAPPVTRGRERSVTVPTNVLRAGPEVIAGTALSGLAGTVAGVLLAGRFGGPSPVVAGGGFTSRELVLVLAALAIGGVRWGSWLLAPVAAAVGGVAVVLMSTAANLHGWEFPDGLLLIAGVAVVCLVVSHSLHRLLSLASSSRPGVPPAGPPPGAGWGPAGSQPAGGPVAGQAVAAPAPLPQQAPPPPPPPPPAPSG